MLLIQNTMYAVALVLDGLLTAYFWVVMVAVLLTWVRPDPYNPIVRTLAMLTDPVFYRVRKWLPFTYIGGLDLSPVVVLVAIQLIKNIVVRTLLQWSTMI